MVDTGSLTKLEVAKPDAAQVVSVIAANSETHITLPS